MSGQFQPARKRVALAGFGVVGQGVYERLAADPARYEVVGAVCRNPARRAAEGAAPAHLLTDDFSALPSYDILVEAIGGVAPAEDYVLAALARGADVVSANKTLVSRRYETLARAAAESGARLRYSAAVGGGVPMLETVDACAAAGEIAEIEAVLNGTTNFVLDRIGAGLPAAEAIRLAQEAGFAEADPSADIDGVDAAEKLSLLARHAFGANVAPDAIPRDRLAEHDDREIRTAQEEGAPYKQVARARATRNGLELDVRLRRVDGGAPLAAPRREENCLVVTLAGGARRIVSGKGAGRDPTADSVFSDLLVLTAPAPVLA